MICTLLTAIGLLGTASVAPSGPSAVAELSLPWVFSDHMVLQRGVPIRIAGEAIPHTQITVEFGGESEATGADAAGRWRLELAARPATFDGEELVVRSGDRELRFADVVIGDVWLCAGQSNMDFPVARAIGGSKASREATRIRLCKRTGSPTAAARPFTTDELAKISGGRFYDGEWQLASPSSVSKFSAVGFSFGRYLEDALDVPIGLIDVSVGGSTTEGWISRERLTRDESIAPLVRDYLASPLTHSFIKERVALNLQTWAAGDQQSARPVHFFEPGFLFEHAIAGLTQTPIRGVCWYQGESNAHLPRTADKLFRTLLEDWRAAWSIADLPFYYVQLPGMNRPTWPRFREVQAGWLDDPDVGMAVTIDLGHPTDVHPRDKAPIGERLARLALARTYGLDVADSGPTAPVVKRTGDRLIVSFSGAQVLRWAPGRDASGFEIAGADRRYYPATAVIDGQRVVLTSPEVGRPSAARYCWAPDPEWSLVGRAGLPAAPFRVQSWAPTRVACIGDSITAGHGLDDPARHSYPAQLQAMLGDGFDVRNFGHSGTCVVQSTMRGAWHRAFRRNPEHQDALLFRPDVVVSNLGINDVMDWESSNGSFVDDYLALIQDYRELGTHPKVLLWTPLAPLFPGQTFHGDPHVAEIGRSIEVVARRARARTVDMEPALNEHPDWFPDHIHPDARGAAAIAGVVRAGLADSRFIDADPRRVRLYVLTGQSNALGTTADRNAVDTSPGAHPADASTRFFWRNRSTRGGDENAASLGDSGGEWTTLQVQQGEGSNKTFWGPDFGFARSLHASGERDFAIVKACRSGGGNGLWSKDSDDDHMYRLVVDTVDAAIEALPPSTDVEVAALLYLQGESDNLSEARASKERLVELARNLRRDLPDATRMRVLVAGIAAPGTTRDLVRAGQREAAQRDPSISYVSTLDLVERLYDGLHFDRTAKIELGRRFARTWAAMGGVSAWRSTKR